MHIFILIVFKLIHKRKNEIAFMARQITVKQQNCTLTIQYRIHKTKRMRSAK